VLPDVRIFTWGYDADVDNLFTSASQNTVHQHASNLLSDLADLLEERDAVSSLESSLNAVAGFITEIC
jgi:mannitol/fructose-specific phosphotransferase system IIA component (Ntr-type)